MNEQEAEISRLVGEAGDLPDGPTKLALLERAVQLADAANDRETAYDLRMALIECAQFTGRPDVSVVAYAWCLAEFDREPERFDDHDLLWKYKWIMDSASEFAEIPLAKIDEMLADLERRFRACGEVHAYQQTRLKVALNLDRMSVAEDAMAKLRITRAGSLSDCPACATHEKLRFHLERDELDDAVSVAKPLLNGKQTCREQPALAYSRLMVPLMKLGRIEQARGLQRMAAVAMKSENGFGMAWPDHITFLALDGQMPAAKRLIGRRSASVLADAERGRHMALYLAIRLYLERLRRAGRDTAALQLPEPFPRPDAGERYHIEPLQAHLLDAALTIARRFDARNGNRRRETEIAQQFDLLEHATPWEAQ